MSISTRFGAVRAACATAALLLAGSASAGTITVTEPTDPATADGLCSLREAIQAANTDAAVDGCTAGSGADTIVFASALQGSTFTLATAALPAVTTPVTIDGQGQTATVVAAAGSRHVVVADGGALTVRSLMLTGGTADVGGSILVQQGGTLAVDGANFMGNTATGAMGTQGGGAIYSDGGTVTIRSATLADNAASGASGSGGAVFNNGGTLTVDTATFSANTANRAGGAIEANAGTTTLTAASFDRNDTGANPGNGGALHVTGAGTVDATGGTVMANTAVEGGGFWCSSACTMTVDGTTFDGNTASGNDADSGGGALYNDGMLTLTDVTVTNNRATGTSGSGGADVRLTDVTVADNRAGGNGGGLLSKSTDGSFRFGNTIVGDNTAAAGDDCFGTFQSAGFNLVEATAGCTLTGVTASNLTAVNPGLAPLADNGGPTRTRALVTASPAINAGASGLPFDQRGFPRVVGPSADIGAFEFGAMPVAGEDEVAGLGEGAFTLGPVAPNPVRSTASLQVTVRDAGRVEVALYDALGRQVRTLYDGHMAPGTPVTVTLDVRTLPAGVYIVRAAGETFAGSQRVTVVR